MPHSPYLMLLRPSSVQEEIYKNGPVSVEFLVIPAFTHYTGGVFACSSVADPEAVGLNPWVATNHEVFIVGWGEEAGTPYWIVQNSWCVRRAPLHPHGPTPRCQIESVQIYCLAVSCD